MLLDGTVREDAHADMISDRPLRDIAIGIAAMVGETADTPALGSIDEL